MISILMVVAFFATALAYSMAGLAGGSSYVALMMFWGLPQTVVPVIALVCNIVVSGGNSINYLRAGLVRKSLLIPHSAFAIPFAYLGGRMHLNKEWFEILVATCLILASLFSLLRRKHEEGTCYQVPPLWLAAVMGAVLGFLSGVVGIGGGVFLAPFLYLMRAGNPKEIASTCTLFIFFNSIAGLLGQYQKLGNVDFLQNYWILPVVVLVGGIIGSLMTLKVLSPKQTARITNSFIFAIACRLWYTILR